jgi:hypothetical protein
LRIRPLFFDYSVRLYEAAVIEAHRLFPGFDACTFEDGPKLGERRIVYTSKTYDLAAAFMRSQFWKLADTGAGLVSESLVARFDDHAATVGGRRRVILDVALDRSFIEEATWDEAAAFLCAGKPIPLDERPRTCDRKLASAMWTEMSLTELAYLNWAAVKKPLGEADSALLAAAAAFDVHAIVSALADGADPNCMNDYGNTPLIVLAENERWETLSPGPGETWAELEKRIPRFTIEERVQAMEPILAAGGHIDLAGPYAVTPLVAAMQRRNEPLVDYLLACGADDTINCYDDEPPCDWPTAWDHAASDCSIAEPDQRDVAERIWATLQRHRQGPDGSPPSG